MAFKYFNFNFLINSNGFGKGLIYEFNLDSILNAKCKASVSPVNKSRFNFYYKFKNSFCIIDDCSIIIGINTYRLKFLLYEEMDKKYFANIIGKYKKIMVAVQTLSNRIGQVVIL